jgi:hypothetical protein
MTTNAVFVLSMERVVILVILSFFYRYPNPKNNLFRVAHAERYNRAMFKHLTNFGYERNKKEALGFYLAYLILFVLIGAMVVVIIGVATNTVPTNFSDTFTKGEEVGAAIVGLGSATLSILILSAKKESRYGFVLLALISGVLCLFGGGLFGFIIPAYFTTLRLRAVSATAGAT